LVLLVALIDINICHQHEEQVRLFENNLFFNAELLKKAHPDQILMYCESDLVWSNKINFYVQWLR
jgi:hypothetical protein